jgi:molybdopterin/thiamine biosynthesis adenylyltransferase
MSLSAAQIERYARHLMLKEIGGVGQKKLLDAHIAIVGLGALGGPASLYLAAAGVGRLTLIDDDTVTLSNLQRQIVFQTSDIGEDKVGAARRRLEALNPDCRIETVRTRLTAQNAGTLLAGAEMIIDGSDNFETRFCTNDACLMLERTLITGAVGRWTGQVSTFKAGLTLRREASERRPCYRCLVPEAPETEETCAAVGVVGPLTGLVASRMALEAIKEVTNAGDSLAGRLWIVEGLTGEMRTLTLRPDPNCPSCGPGASSAP